MRMTSFAGQSLTAAHNRRSNLIECFLDLIDVIFRCRLHGMSEVDFTAEDLAVQEAARRTSLAPGYGCSSTRRPGTRLTCRGTRVIELLGCLVSGFQILRIRFHRSVIVGVIE